MNKASKRSPSSTNNFDVVDRPDGKSDVFQYFIPGPERKAPLHALSLREEDIKGLILVKERVMDNVESKEITKYHEMNMVQVNFRLANEGLFCPDGPGTVEKK